MNEYSSKGMELLENTDVEDEYLKQAVFALMKQHWCPIDCTKMKPAVQTEHPFVMEEKG